MYFHDSTHLISIHSHFDVLARDLCMADVLHVITSQLKKRNSIIIQKYFVNVTLTNDVKIVIL
jgi:hypothetical protein